MRYRQARGAAIAAGVAVSALAGCAGTSPPASEPLEKMSIIVGTLPTVDSAGLFIAEQEGLFRQQGLNVTIKLATSSQQAIRAQRAGAYDITSADYITYLDDVLLRHARLRIVAESSFLQPNVLTLLTKAGSSVQSIRQLKHRTVSVNAPGNLGTLLVDSVLTENGVPRRTVKFDSTVPFPAAGPDLAAGKVSAAFVSEPFVSRAEMTSGAQELADLDQGATANFPIQGVAVTQSWARRNPNTLAAFERAYSQGQAVADTDRGAVEQALETYLALKPAAAALVSLPSFPTGVDATRLQRLVDAMVRFRLLAKKYSAFKISTIIGNG